MTTTNPTPTASQADQNGATVEAALNDPNLATDPAPVPAPAPDTMSVDELAKLDDAEIDKLLEGTAPSKSSATPEPTPEPTAAPAPAGTPDPAGEEPSLDAEGKPIMIPIQRLNKEISERRRLEDENKRLMQDRAYLAGKDAASKAAAPAAPVVDQEELTTANLVKLKNDETKLVTDMAKLFDDGKITLAQYEEKKAALTEKVAGIRNTLNSRLNDVRAAKAVPTEDKIEQAISNDTRLAELNRQILNDNPWMGNVPETMTDALHEAAESYLDKQGLNLPKHPTMSDVLQRVEDIRLAMVVVAKQWGLDKMVAAPAPAATPNPAPAGAKTPDKQEQIRDKLKLAASHPPVTGDAGAALPTDVIKADNYESRSDADLAKLSPKELDMLIERSMKPSRAA